MAEAFSSLSVEHSSIVDRVVEELRRAVFEGEVESGTPLREVALADSLGVSRSTVREALGVLVAEGLATREPNRGVSIATPDPASVRDVIAARRVLELAGVRAWPTASGAAREELRRCVADYARAVAEGASYQTLNRQHLCLHVALVGLTGSARLVAMAEQLTAELRLTLAQIERARRNAHDQADSHAGLLALLERGEVEAAARELDHHLDAAEVDIAEALGPG